MMKHKNGYIGLAVLAILISVIAFAVPTEKTASLWTAYIFTLVAILGQIYVWKQGNQKSKFLGLSTLYVGSIYLVAQIVVFAIFKAVPTFPTWSAVVICCVILGIAIISILSVQSAQTEIERVENKANTKVSYIRNMQTEVEMLAEIETNPEVKEKLKELAEKIRFSDPVSSEKLQSLENKIAEEIKAFGRSEDKIKSIEKIETLVTQRNKVCKNLK